jgi:hypothetical protein
MFGPYYHVLKLNVPKKENAFDKHVFNLQGGALNRGLFFADPPPSLLGAVSGKISKIR